MQVPDRGDLIYLDFDPQVGHEQAGIRPAIVLSPRKFNALTGFAAVCPITGQEKGYPYEIKLPSGLPIYGVILTDQVKSLDWRARLIGIKGRAPMEIVEDCIDRIHTFLSYEESYEE